MRAWENFVEQIKELIGLEAVTKWVKTLKIIHFDAGNLYLEALDAFHASWFEEHLRNHVRTLLRNNNHRIIKVHLSIAAQPIRGKKKNSWHRTLSIAPTLLSKEATFDNFFKEKQQEKTLTLLQNCLSTPYAYNPIYLYGPAGCGKTHLLMAIAQKLQTEGKSPFFVTSEHFTEQVVTAMQTGEMQKFRQIYRKSDALIIDDIHLIGGRVATQEELFHTFNALHALGKLLVFAAPSRALLLPHIEPRLTSRFEWGLSLALEEPKEKKKILYLKAALWEFPFSEEWYALLERELGTSLPTMVKGLETLVLKASLGGVPVEALTLEEGKKWLAPLVATEAYKKISPKKIVDLVAEHYRVESDAILGRSQTQTLSTARQVAMYLCRGSLKMAYTKIGEFFERDHSTVMTSIRSIEKKERETLSFLQETIKSL